jgi:predicted DsbA family dithiol-disulfide isomerase
VRIDQLRKNYHIAVHWKAFPLHPDTPEEGLTLGELYAGRGVDINQVLTRLKQVADELGLPLGERKRTYNSRLAQELAKWAESKGRGDLFDEAVFRTYFVDGRNIGKADELVTIAKAIGLSEKEAKVVLESRTFREAVDADWQRSRALGITGVPTFVIGQRGVVGFQPYEALERFLIDRGVKKRKNSEAPRSWSRGGGCR